MTVLRPRTPEEAWQSDSKLTGKVINVYEQETGAFGEDSFSDEVDKIQHNSRICKSFLPDYMLEGIVNISMNFVSHFIGPVARTLT